FPTPEHFSRVVLPQFLRALQRPPARRSSCPGNRARPAAHCAVRRARSGCSPGPLDNFLPPEPAGGGRKAAACSDRAPPVSVACPIQNTLPPRARPLRDASPRSLRLTGGALPRTAQVLLDCA